MPLYEYRCLKCDRHTDKIENLNGPKLSKCPHCGGKVESVLTAPAIQFKGSGWYVNDYGRKTGGDSGKNDKNEKGDKGEKGEKADKSGKNEKSESSSGKSEGKSDGSSKESKKPASSSKEK